MTGKVKKMRNVKVFESAGLKGAREEAWEKGRRMREALLGPDRKRKATMKPLKAWAHVTSSQMMVQFSMSRIFWTREEARRALGEMSLHGWRVARVEIREV